MFSLVLLVMPDVQRFQKVSMNTDASRKLRGSLALGDG
jgi:hypothetical protein